ncbi:MAG: hypothetical protein L0346_21405 [Chloroflexi bacterium]|nr:hypothetical protein [Chloroflexota bacterium]
MQRVDQSAGSSPIDLGLGSGYGLLGVVPTCGGWTAVLLIVRWRRWAGGRKAHHPLGDLLSFLLIRVARLVGRFLTISGRGTADQRFDRGGRLALAALAVLGKQALHVSIAETLLHLQDNRLAQRPAGGVLGQVVGLDRATPGRRQTRPPGQHLGRFWGSRLNLGFWSLALGLVGLL